MKTYLQVGYGMMAHCCHLLERWGSGGVILSPRDLSPKQLARTAKDISDCSDATILLDPQFYVPNADHHGLLQHNYWPQNYQSGTFLTGSGVQSLTTSLIGLNVDLGCDSFVIPGFYCASMGSQWLDSQNAFIAEATKASGGAFPLLATVALSSDVLKNDDEMATLVEAASKWKVDGVYLVPEHPPGQYLVEDGVWLGNLLDCCAGLKIAGKQVIVGYANQQQLLCAAAKVDVVATGTWMNVRSFTVDKFDEQDASAKKRATWFYAPHLFTEFKVAALDVAKKLGVLADLKPRGDYVTEYIEAVFSGATPSTVLTESSAFRHYLTCFMMQAEEIASESYEATVRNVSSSIELAKRRLKDLAKHHITGENRDFSGCVDASLQAITLLDKARGPLLRRSWSKL